VVRVFRFEVQMAPFVIILEGELLYISGKDCQDIRDRP
jgi:hypothetical protein